VCVDKGLYVVTDIPTRFLNAGDTFFNLTWKPTASGPSWDTGRVGLFCGVLGVSRDPNGVIDVTEKDGVRETSAINNFSARVSRELALGPRRGGKAGASALTPAQQRAVVAAAEVRLGKPYQPIGEGSADPASSTDVDVVKHALEAGDVGVVVSSCTLHSPPLDLYLATHSVDHVEVDVGDTFDLVLSAVMVDPNSPRQSIALKGWYSDKQPYTVISKRIPPGATFDDMPGNNSHWLQFTPQAKDAGSTYYFDVEVKANTVNPEDGSERWTIEPCVVEIYVRPAPAGTNPCSPATGGK
jgi:hypothetical protein